MNVHFNDGRLVRTTLSALVLWLAMAGLPAAADAPDHAQIVVKDFMFKPMELSIKAGDTVTWTNQDDEPHTVNSDTGLYRSAVLDTGESFSFKFDKPGSYHFTCSIHKWMVGTIVVQ